MVMRCDAVFFILGCGFDVILTFIPKGAFTAPLNPVFPGLARIDANTLLKRPMFLENAVSRSATRVSVFEERVSVFEIPVFDSETRVSVFETRALISERGVMVFRLRVSISEIAYLSF